MDRGHLREVHGIKVIRGLAAFENGQWKENRLAVIFIGTALSRRDKLFVKSSDKLAIRYPEDLRERPPIVDFIRIIWRLRPGLRAVVPCRCYRIPRMDLSDAVLTLDRCALRPSGLNLVVVVCTHRGPVTNCVGRSPMMDFISYVDLTVDGLVAAK